MYCNKCGYRIPDDAKFCIKCGFKVNNDNSEKISNLINTENDLLAKVKTLYSLKKELDNQIKNREDFFVSTELKYIDTLDGIAFEEYITVLLDKLGYKAQTTKASQDNGGDVIAELNNVKYVFQCKNYSDTVGNKAVQEVYAAKGIYKCDKAVVITNNFFTKQAQEEANILGILLWDRNLLKMLLYQSYSFDISHMDDNVLKEYENDYEEDDDVVDPFLMEAIEAVVEARQASTSFIQRRFKVKYARAGRIIDQMEERGIISGFQGSKPREVLITKERWEYLKNEMFKKALT